MNRKKANEFFKEEEREEITSDQVERASHYTYRDGFRLGFGIFIGFIAGSLLLILASYIFNFILKSF